MNWFNALFHKFYTWKVSFPHEVIEYALCVSCGSLKRFPHIFTTYRLPFCKKKSSQSSHLKAPFSHELIQFGFEVLFDWKATLARSHDVYIRKASFPHELFKLTFCEKHSWQSPLLQKGFSHIMSKIWSPSRRDNTWCSYRAIKMAICMGW